MLTVGQVALAAVDAVEVCGHEDAWATLGADLAQALHLAAVVHLVELEHPQLHLLVPACDETRREKRNGGGRVQGSGERDQHEATVGQQLTFGFLEVSLAGRTKRGKHA